MSISDPTLVHINNPDQFKKELGEVTNLYFSLSPHLTQARSSSGSLPNQAVEDYQHYMGNGLNIMHRLLEYPTLGAVARLGSHFKPNIESSSDALRIEFRQAPEALALLADVDSRMSALFHQVAAMRPATVGPATDRLAGEDRTGRSIK